MIAIKTTVRNGRIELEVPSGLSDGTEVLAELTPLLGEKMGMDESEWRDDPPALADWEAWIPTIEPLELTPAEQAQWARFNEDMRRFNLEAGRQQMEQGPVP
jgi:hypothetical protein